VPRREATFKFITECRAAKSADDVARLLFAATAECGMSLVACASHADPLNPPAGAVALVNYPQEWLDRFSSQNYAANDPVFWAARRSTAPFRWSDVLERLDLRPDQRRILSEARDCGVTDGFTIPIHAPDGLSASCSFVPGPDGFDPLCLPDLQFMATHAYDEARRCSDGATLLESVRLTERQRQCLGLAANAKSDWAIGQILGISPRTVHHTIENAKKKYGVSHRIQAVWRAIDDGEINPRDYD
jgi:LuxR family transcriptional regulator, quorum-sensing system regulator BjaR1